MAEPDEGKPKGTPQEPLGRFERRLIRAPWHELFAPAVDGPSIKLTGPLE